MAEPSLDELNTGTRKEIMPSVADNFFKSGPIIRYMRENRMKVFPGGTLIQENFLFRPMKGDFYQKGAQFDVTKRQTKTGMTFTVKKAYVNVTEYLEDVEIELRAEHDIVVQPAGPDEGGGTHGFAGGGADGERTVFDGPKSRVARPAAEVLTIEERNEAVIVRARESGDYQQSRACHDTGECLHRSSPM